MGNATHAIATVLGEAWFQALLGSLSLVVGGLAIYAQVRTSRPRRRTLYFKVLDISPIVRLRYHSIGKEHPPRRWVSFGRTLIEHTEAFRVQFDITLRGVHDLEASDFQSARPMLFDIQVPILEIIGVSATPGNWLAPELGYAPGERTLAIEAGWMPVESVLIVTALTDGYPRLPPRCTQHSLLNTNVKPLQSARWTDQPVWLTRLRRYGPGLAAILIGWGTPACVLWLYR